MGRPSTSNPDSRQAKPTLRTVAEATGFAVTTVSRALADDPRIAKATRQTVAEAAQRLGYVPDRAAQRLRTGRTKVISLLLNSDHEFLGFSSEILSGFTRALAGTGYAVTITPDALGGDRLGTVRNILRNRLADGVIFTRVESFDPRVQFLTEQDFPFVSHGRTEFTTPHPWVDFDNAGFADWGVERLVAKGRRRIMIVMPDWKFTFARHLYQGFMAAVRRHDVDFEIPEAINLESSTEEISEFLRNRMAEPDPPDGFICVGEVAALCTTAAMFDVGRVLGRDVDVLAKRASPVFDQLRPRLETIHEDLRQTGHEMGRLLLARLEGAPVEGLNVLLPARPDPDE